MRKLKQDGHEYPPTHALQFPVSQITAATDIRLEIAHFRRGFEVIG